MQNSVIELFKGIDNKKDCIFIKCDVRQFHPSILESIFKKSILFAKEYHHIPDEDVKIIDRYRKSLLIIITHLAPIIKKSDCGLYREYGLVTLRNIKIIKIFNDVGLSTDIKTNSKVVDYLDITFNLNNGTYKSYKKLNDPLLFINKSSNHPLKIINQLPRIISDRLSRNSSNKEVFDGSKGEYKQALKHSDYSNISLSFQQSNTSHVKR